MRERDRQRARGLQCTLTYTGMARSSVARWRTGPPPLPKQEPKQEENGHDEYEYGTTTTEDAKHAAELEHELTPEDRRLFIRRMSVKSASREVAAKLPRMVRIMAASSAAAAPTRHGGGAKRRRGGGGGGGDADEKEREDDASGIVSHVIRKSVPQEVVRRGGAGRGTKRRGGQGGRGGRAAMRSHHHHHHHHHHQLDQFEENGGNAGVAMLTNDPENEENANANNNPLHNAIGVDEYGEEDDDGGDYVIPYGNDDYDDDDLGGGHDDGDDVDATY